MLSWLVLPILAVVASALLIYSFVQKGRPEKDIARKVTLRTGLIFLVFFVINLVMVLFND